MVYCQLAACSEFRRCTCIRQTRRIDGILPVLIFYEHATTLSQEVQLIWGRKWAGATIVFLLNGYATLVFGLTLVLHPFYWYTAVKYVKIN
ncbi:hypothetical protein AcW1_000649 [Taiwanofungus camphoratus]|nr:hypothetical protein AcW1_000649 [Antrodia cinnamomea]